MVSTTRRRVSYVIPAPAADSPVPRLQLSPSSGLGSISPLLLRHPDQSASTLASQSRKSERHPRHRLGIASLVLDESSHLLGHDTPEGILYSGGRDGMIMAWDLELPMKKKEKSETSPGSDGRGRVGRWEIMTGWDDDLDDETDEEDRPTHTSDGDVLGEVLEAGRSRRRKKDSRKLEKDEWQIDFNAFNPGKHSQFRQCTQTHTDWVNDIILANSNQTVISASSDGTVKAWDPHTSEPTDSSMLGMHSDYVRCLAYCRERNWVVSGSFDRTIKLWDLTRSKSVANTNSISPLEHPDPLVTLNPPDPNAPKASIYALAADPLGHAIAAGSPERVVRLWDPRSGKRTGKLVGHTDNIRAVLISEDARYLLTGSADASIKLWSLATQRCLHTFTHHTDSIWALSSSHPSLEIFYAGDRTGLVCRVDVERCADVSEGEAIVLCQAGTTSSERKGNTGEGINAIAASSDHTMLWTASSSSNISRWKIPPARGVRAAASGLLEGEPFGQDSTFLPTGHRGYTDVDSHPHIAGIFRRYHSGGSADGERDNDAFVYSPPQSSSGVRPKAYSSSLTPGDGQESDTTQLLGIPFASLVKLTSANDPFTPYALGRRIGPGGLRDVEVATLYSAASVMSVPKTALRSPIQPSFIRGRTSSGSVRGDAGSGIPVIPTAQQAFEDRELAADATPLVGEPEEIIKGEKGLVRSVILNDRMHVLTVDTAGEVAIWDIIRGVCRGRFTNEDVEAAIKRASGDSTTGDGKSERERSPREALETVKEIIEGEAVVAPWSAVDTKTGVLNVHLLDKCFEAEVYADEVGYAGDKHFNDESRLNLGKWVLRNLFLGFIRELQAERRKQENSPESQSLHSRRVTSSLSSNESKKSRAGNLSAPSPLPSSTTVIRSPKMIPALPPKFSPTPRSSPLVPPMIPIREATGPGSGAKVDFDTPTAFSANDATPMPRTTRTPGIDVATPIASSSPKEDYFTVRGRQAFLIAGDDTHSSNPRVSVGDTTTALPTTPGGGIMGRLKNLGKTKKLPNDIPGTAIVSTPAEVQPKFEDGVKALDAPLSPRQILLANPLAPPPSIEAPPVHLPQSISTLISEEASLGWTPVYRGTITSAANDARALEEAMPLWLLEYLLFNQTPSIVVQKVSFVLLPWPCKDSNEQLPELLNTTQSKLTASRFLRVRKLTAHVQDKLEKVTSSPSLSSTPRSSTDSRSLPPGNLLRPRAEDLYEILCNDMVLPLDMTLAVVRQYVWRQSGELAMHYRRRAHKGSM